MTKIKTKTPMYTEWLFMERLEQLGFSQLTTYSGQGIPPTSPCDTTFCSLKASDSSSGISTPKPAQPVWQNSAADMYDLEWKLQQTSGGFMRILIGTALGYPSMRGPKFQRPSSNYDITVGIDAKVFLGIGKEYSGSSCCNSFNLCWVWKNYQHIYKTKVMFKGPFMQ